MMEHTLLKVHHIETSKTYTKDDLWRKKQCSNTVYVVIYQVTTCIILSKVFVYHLYFTTKCGDKLPSLR